MLILIRLLEEKQDYNQMITAHKKKTISLVYEKNVGAEAGGNKAGDITSIFFAYGTSVDSV